MRKAPVLLALVHAFVLALVLATPVALGGTTGALSGTVADAEGVALPGVRVTIESPALIGGWRTLTTGADGRFSFPAIAPGVYAVRMELPGFATQEKTDVQVRLDRTTTLVVTMPEAKLSADVTVTAGTPQVDATRVGAAENFTDAYMQKVSVGSANRSYESVVSQAAGVSGANVLGSTSTENIYLVDGLTSNDAATGDLGTRLNFDVIQEVSFQATGFEAEYGGATGGVVNLITKSGGNSFSGSFDVRYRDESFNENGDHFDRDAQTSSYFAPAATLGGPLVQDRLWFFAGYERIDSESTPSGAPTTAARVSDNWMAKLTWQLSQSWQLVGKVTGNPNEIDDVDSSPLVLPEATSRFETSTNIYQVESLATLSPSLLWNLQLGRNRQTLDNDPQSGDLERISHLDLATQVRSRNYFNAQYSTRDRVEGKTSVTYLVDGASGAHELKAGVGYGETEFEFRSFLPGGYLYGDFFGGPYLLFYAQDPGTQTYQGAAYSAYVQDAWTLGRGLTVKAGLRWDRATYDSYTGERVADLDLLQPRVGAAWDATGDGKTVARGSWGRFMNQAGLTLPFQNLKGVSSLGRYASCRAFIGDLDTCRAVAAAIGSVVIDDPSGDFAGEGWLLLQPYVPANDRLEPGTRATYADSFLVGVDRELFAGTTVGVQYVYKETKDIIDNTCNGNWPGPPSAGAPCGYLVVGNLEGLRRLWRGAIFHVDSRPAPGVQLNLSYTYGISEGNVEATQYNGPDFDYYPYHFVNRYGYLSDDRRHRVKLNGFADLPWGFTAGLSATWESAFRWTPLDVTDPTLPYDAVFVEPRGNREAGSYTQVDLQLAKAFQLGPVRLSAIGSVLNLFGTERVTGVCAYTTGCGAVQQGEALSWQQPRRYEIGFRAEF